MLNKFYILVSTLIFTAFVAVSGAQAVSVDPSFIANYNNDTGVGAINDPYAFTATADTNLKFIFSVNHPAGDFDVGIADLVMTWSDGNVQHIITNGAALVVGVPFFHTLLVADGEQTLTVTGNFLSNGGGYTLTVAAVPLPPAVIAFATAMLGVGFLARRRRKKKEVFA